MWGSMSPPKPRGTTRTYRVQLLKTGRSLHPTREYITGTVRAFHEEARAVCSCGETGKRARFKIAYPKGFARSNRARSTSFTCRREVPTAGVATCAVGLSYSFRQGNP